MTERDGVALAQAARGGLCSRCRQARLVRTSRGSAFVLCGHPELPKYPRVPVLRCRGFSNVLVPAARA